MKPEKGAAGMRWNRVDARSRKRVYGGEEGGGIDSDGKISRGECEPVGEDDPEDGCKVMAMSRSVRLPALNAARGWVPGGAGLMLLAVLGFSACQESEEGVSQPAKGEEAVVAESAAAEKEPEFFQADPCTGTEFSFETFDIQAIPDEGLPYMNHAKSVLRRDLYDRKSVPLHVYQGRINYHPVYIAQHALHVFDVYRETGEAEHLEQVKRMLEQLVASSLKVDSTLLFPYAFNFSLHGQEAETMEAPWFSGMAQGQVLSLACRLHSETGDAAYLDIAEKTFQSFLRIKGEGVSPWISCIDEEGHLWLEEYPREMPCLTLNGMNFAIFGVYEYYQLTKSPEVEKVLNGALTTIKANIDRFRVPGGISYYCIKHRVQAENYHRVHIRQLKMLYKMTGDPVFQDTAGTFETDH